MHGTLQVTLSVCRLVGWLDDWFLSRFDYNFSYDHKVLKIDKKDEIDKQREGRETQSTTAEFVKLTGFPLHFHSLVFQMSLLLNGLTDEALLGLDLFIFSKFCLCVTEHSFN